MEIEKLKGYNDNISDEIITGQHKRYIALSQKKVKIWFRMRANIIDPAPRQPYHPISIWKWKFCGENDQSTKHYVRDSRKIEGDVFHGLNRDILYSVIQTLDCEEPIFQQVTFILKKIYYLLNK